MAKTKKASGFVIQRGIRVSGSTLAERGETDRARKARLEADKPLRRTADEVLVAGDEDRLQELIDDGTIDQERLQRLGVIADADKVPGGKGRPASTRKGPDRRMSRALAGNEGGSTESRFPDDYPATEAQIKALTEAGLDSPEKVDDASDEELRGIDGIGDATVEKLRGRS